MPEVTPDRYQVARQQVLAEAKQRREQQIRSDVVRSVATATQSAREQTLDGFLTWCKRAEEFVKSGQTNPEELR